MRLWFGLLLLTASCGGSSGDWVRDLDLSHEYRSVGSRRPAEPQGDYVRRTIVIGEGPPASIDARERIAGPADSSRWAPASGDVGPFRNTYYDFPKDDSERADKALYDRSCRKIADVSASFHDAVCVQGSGKIATGQTVSFARRDCECASVCPRTGQRICFDALDPDRYPWGRGATGKPITPLSTVAVDTSIIPFGAKLFIPEAVGLPRPDGSAHDGCFVAEDRGLKVKGEHIDIFTGDPSTTSSWNARLPSNRGIHVFVNSPECR